MTAPGKCFPWPSSDPLVFLAPFAPLPRSRPGAGTKRQDGRSAAGRAGPGPGAAAERASAQADGGSCRPGQAAGRTGPSPGVRERAAAAPVPRDTAPRRSPRQRCAQQTERFPAGSRPAAAGRGDAEAPGLTSTHSASAPRSGGFTCRRADAQRCSTARASAMAGPGGRRSGRSPPPPPPPGDAFAAAQAAPAVCRRRWAPRPPQPAGQRPRWRAGGRQAGWGGTERRGGNARRARAPRRRTTGSAGRQRLCSAGAEQRFLWHGDGGRKKVLAESVRGNRQLLQTFYRRQNRAYGLWVTSDGGVCVGNRINKMYIQLNRALPTAGRNRVVWFLYEKSKISLCSDGEMLHAWGENSLLCRCWLEKKINA